VSEPRERPRDRSSPRGASAYAATEIAPPPRPSLRARLLLPALAWLGVLAAGALLLYGRYDWQEAGGKFARSGYLSSLYFFLLVVPTAYYLTRVLSGRVVAARAVAAVVFVAGALPYHWLGLQRFRAATVIYPAPADTRMRWFPAALSEGGFPYEPLFFLTLALAFGLAVWLIAGGARTRSVPRRLWPLLAAFAAIVVQMWMHTSLRSPYTYTQYFEEATWNHKCLLPGGQAAVNGDIRFFTTLNDLFNGLPGRVDTMLLRRSFVHYLSSPFTYFWNAFHVYLVLNALLWLAAVVCGYGWARKVVHPDDRRAPLLVAALVCIGNGFIYFAAQPMHYLAGYAAVMIALYLYEALVVERRLWLLYGVAFGLCAATYDLFPLFPALLVYGAFRKARLRDTALGLAVALVVYFGFPALAFQVLRLPNNAYNTDHGTSALAHILTTLRHPDAGDLYYDVVGFFRVYGQNLLLAFFVVEALVAAVALLVLPRRQQLLVAILLLPSFLLNAYLYFGKVPWAGTLIIELPRFTYSAYPAVYLAAALGLARLPWRWAWAAVGVLFLWHNVDVLGLPDMHFHFYFPQKLFFLRK
jgi:hypothetical protein